MQRTVRRAARTAVATVVAVLAVSSAVGCTAVNGVRVAQTELAAAGFTDARVNYAPNLAGATIVQVRYRTDATDTAMLGNEYLRAAKLIWQEAPLRFDRVRLDATNEPAACAGECRPEFTRAELEAEFGARDQSLDKDPTAQLYAVGLGVVAGLMLVVVLVVRSRERQRRINEPWRAGGVPARGPMGADSGWPLPPPPPGQETAPPAYADRDAHRGPLVPPPPTERQSWPDTPSAPPPPEPTYDIWERPPS